MKRGNLRGEIYYTRRKRAMKRCRHREDNCNEETINLNFFRDRGMW